MKILASGLLALAAYLLLSKWAVCMILAFVVKKAMR
jgi:hypothetical protein